MHAEARRSVAEHARLAPAGQMVVFSDPTKTRLQEESYHAIIGDIAKAVPLMGQMVDVETWKRLLIDAFVRVMREEAQATGEGDPFPELGRVVPSLDGRGVVQLGVQSRGFSKSIASQFREYLICFGAERGVDFTQK